MNQRALRISLTRFKIIIPVVVTIFQKPLSKICSCNYIKARPCNLFSLISVLVFLFFFKEFVIEGELISNIVLASGIWQSDSVIYG